MTRATNIDTTNTNIDIDEHKISQQLGAAGLRFQRAPLHLGDGYRIFFDQYG